MINNKKIVLVTGGSRGIGAETSKLLAKKGYKVVINYLKDDASANNLTNQINTEGGDAISIQADIGSESNVISLFKNIDSVFGPVTALVNNAAQNQINGTGLIEEISSDVLENVFRTNVFGVFFTCREAILRMKKCGFGGIVNVSSEASRFGGSRIPVYAASKGAINTLTLTLAKEVAMYGIRANAISPGKISSGPEYLLNTKFTNQDTNLNIPMGRLGNPKEVAECIYWLLSDKSSYVSGAIIPVNGGR